MTRSNPSRLVLWLLLCLTVLLGGCLYDRLLHLPAATSAGHVLDDGCRALAESMAERPHLPDPSAAAR